MNDTGTVTTVAFAALPAYGHLYPLLPLAEALQRAGAAVSVAVGPPFLGSLPVPTVPGITGDVTLDDVTAEVFERFPQVRDDMAQRWVPAFFGDVNARRVLPALREQWGRNRPDLVVYEALNPAAAVAAAELGAPSVAFGLGHFYPPVLSLLPVAMRATGPEVPPEWSPWEFAAGATLPVGTSYVDPMPRALQMGPVNLLTDRMAVRPDGWHDPDAAPADVPPRDPHGPPRVYATLGTVAYGAVDVLRRAVTEAAEHGVEVLVACGPSGDPTLLGALPGNVRVFRYLPQATLMSTVDLIIHHGGAGTMLSAAAHGVPQVVMPQGADQFRNADSIVAAGIGRRIGPDPGAVGEAVGDLLGDAPEGRAATTLQAQIAGMPSPDEVADDLLRRATLSRLTPRVPRARGPR